MAGEKLTARAAATIKPGRYGDGRGLYLVVSRTGARKWVFRFTFDGRVTEMGLGSADGVTLAEVRAAARDARQLLARGTNPIEAARAARAAREGRKTFGQLAGSLIASKSPSWRNAAHRAQWRVTIETYAAPLLALPVDEIDTARVLAVLTPIWQAKPETASRLRGRIEMVLDAAKAQGHRNGENPARWRGHLDKLLPKPAKLVKGHHPALAYAEIPAFVARLRERESTAALALEFTILTAARSAEILGSTWCEIDFEAKIWAVPGSRMKGGKLHRVPLAARALEILEKLAKARVSEFVFPGQRPGRPLSRGSMQMILARMKVDGATPHGFRSGFRDWAGNETHFARDLAEGALAHAIGS